MKERTFGSILVFIGAASFGILSSIVKTAYKLGYTVGQITFVQTLFGMLILWILWGIYQGKRNRIPTPDIEKRHYGLVLSIGIFPGLVGIFYYQCVQLIPASIAIILLMQYLWISVIIDFIFYKNRPTRMQLLTVILILAGSILAAGLIIKDNSTINLKGYAFGFLAAVCYSLFITTSSKVATELPILQKSALMITGACLLTAILFPPRFLLELPWNDLIYRFGILLALLGTVLPPLLFSIGMPKIGISLSAILSAAELPVAVLASYLYLRETVVFSQWLGVMIILFAIILPHLHAVIRHNRYY